MGQNKIPKPVNDTFEQLKREYPFYIVLTSRDGHYYVYRQQGIYQKDTRKIKTLRTYLGRITLSGEFLRRATMTDKDIEKARAIIIANGGKVIMPEEQPQFPENELEVSYERQILTLLSTDGRMSISAISRKIGLPYGKTSTKIRKLEEKYGVRYTIEPGFLERFGIQQFLVVVKFIDEIPNPEDVKKLFEMESRIQLAVWAVGEYNLFLFILASRPTKLKI